MDAPGTQMMADPYEADVHRRAAAERLKAASVADASGPRTGHGRDRWTGRVPWPGWRTFRRAFLVEAGTVAALTAVLVAIIFGLRTWDGRVWLVILPLPVLAGALRRPRHGWLLALEFTLALGLVALADAAWGPTSTGPSEPLLDVPINALLLFLIFWPFAALGRAFGEAAVGRVRRSSSHSTGISVYPATMSCAGVANGGERMDAPRTDRAEWRGAMRLRSPTRLEIVWFLLVAAPVALGAAGTPRHLFGMRDQWSFLLWWIAFASGLVLRSPAALVVTAETAVVFLLASIGHAQEMSVFAPLTFVLAALAAVGIIAGKAVVGAATVLRDLAREHAWRRPRFTRPTAIDVFGGVALLGEALWSVFAAQPAGAYVLLILMPATIFLFAAIRRPAHLSLLGWEVWLLYGLASLIYLRWGHPPPVDPSSPNQETAWGSVFESVILIFVPAWGIAWLGRFAGTRAMAAWRGRSAGRRHTAPGTR